MEVTIFKKGHLVLCSYYRGITVLSLPAKVYSVIISRRIRWKVKSHIQEAHCGFCQNCATVDQLYTLRWVLEGTGECAQPVHMCFVHLQKVFNPVPVGSCGGCSRSTEYSTGRPNMGVQPCQEFGLHCQQ